MATRALCLDTKHHNIAEQSRAMADLGGELET
jgi:hypothetical protein